MSPRKKSITMNDVAREAGVSLKTVSNVVNDWPYVSDETRGKVQQAIQKVGYRPNQNARSLVTGKTKTIGVIVPDVSNPFFGLAMRGCEDRLYESQYNIFLCNSNEDLERERFYLELLMRRGVDGVILWGTRVCCNELKEVIGDEIALVTVDMQDEPGWKNHININVDSVGGAILAVDHLVEQGFHRIAHLMGPQGRETSDRRLAGYKRGLEKNGIPNDLGLVFSERPSIRGGFRAASLTMEDNSIDAIFCYNDLMAVGALVAARKYQKSVPEEIAIIGFDDIALASLVSPALSTIKIDQVGLGKKTGDLVLELLDDEDSSDRTNSPVLFPVELRKRASSISKQTTDHSLEDMLDELIKTLSDQNPFA